MATQVERYERKHQAMRVDALYDLVSDPNEIALRQVLAGIYTHVQRTFTLEYSDQQSSEFRANTDRVFALAMRPERDNALREMRLAIVFERLSQSAEIRKYFCEPGASDSSLDPTATKVAPGAFTSWVVRYLVPYTRDFIDGYHMDVPLYTQSAWVAYARLMPSAPDVHPRERARRRVRVPRSGPGQ